MSIRKSLIALSLVVTALSAAAAGDADRVRSIQLKDGTTLHHYKDGKMAMEDKTGNVLYMQEGAKMEAADGKTITMSGNEVARLYVEKYQANRP